MNNARHLVEGSAPTDYNVGQPKYPRLETGDTFTYSSDTPQKLNYLICILESLDDASLTNWWTHASVLQEVKACILRQEEVLPVGL